MSSRTEAGLSRAWAVLISTGAPFTSFQLSDTSGVNHKIAGDHLRDWVRQGRVQRLPGFRSGRALYQATPKEIRLLEIAKTADPLRNMWQAMRHFVTFAPKDIFAIANTSTVTLSRDTVAKYCWFLETAGYLVIREPAGKRHTEPVYRLVRDTGPLPPERQWRLAAFDPNLEQITFADGIDLP